MYSPSSSSVISSVPVICTRGDLKQQPLYWCSLMMAQECGQGTAGWLLSALRCLGPQLGRREWLLVIQTAWGWKHLEVSSVACLAHGLSWGSPLSTDMWHLWSAELLTAWGPVHEEASRERTFQEDLGKLHSLFRSGHKASFYSVGWNSYKTSQIQGKRTYPPSLNEQSVKKVRSI